MHHLHFKDNYKMFSGAQNDYMSECIKCIFVAVLYVTVIY